MHWVEHERFTEHAPCGGWNVAGVASFHRRSEELQQRGREKLFLLIIAQLKFRLAQRRFKFRATEQWIHFVPIIQSAGQQEQRRWKFKLAAQLQIWQRQELQFQ